MKKIKIKKIESPTDAIFRDRNYGTRGGTQLFITPLRRNAVRLLGSLPNEYLGARALSVH